MNKILLIFLIICLSISSASCASTTPSESMMVKKSPVSPGKVSTPIQITGQPVTSTGQSNNTSHKKPIIGGLSGVGKLPVQIYNPVTTTQTPTYNFVLDSCEITNTRSVHEDTDYASLGVSVSRINGTPQTKSLGNLNNGIHPINLVVGPTPVAANPNTPVIIAFQIINSGYTDHSAIVDAAALAIGSLFGNSTGVQVIAAATLKYLGGIFTANCDGTVAVDRISTNGQQLAEWTASGPHSVRTFYPGTDSATGCGSNSKYYVTWHVEKVTSGTPTNLLRRK